MDKLKFFDLELSKDGPLVKSKYDDLGFWGKFEVDANDYPTSNYFGLNTIMRRAYTDGDIELYLEYRNKDEARKAYRNFQQKDNLGKALDLIEKLEYDTAKKLRETRKREYFLIF